MARILETVHLIVAQAMSGNNAIISPAVEIKYLDNIACQFSWTGTPQGNMNIEASLDYALNPDKTVANAGTWIALKDAAGLLPFAAGGAAGTELVDLNQLSMPWIRFHYVNTSGSGTLDAWIFGKAVG